MLYTVYRLDIALIKSDSRHRSMVMYNIFQKDMKLRMLIIICLFSIIVNSALAQHRGDNLAFQGILDQNESSVKAEAMGGAYTSISGDLESMFWNPAGLIGIDELKVSLSANNYNSLWRENQVYRPNRQFVSMSFILDGLYTPDPANNGKLDYEIFKDDSTYFVAEPTLGQDLYGEKAADWQLKKSGFSFNNASAAYPINVFDQQFVVAAAYGSQSRVTDYDRNQTYLDPHPGTDEYGGHIDRITSPGDSVRINWSDFQRMRDVEMQNINFALGYQLNANLMFGAGMRIMNSESDDTQNLSRIGYFDLLDGPNSFRFSYDTLDISTNGVSEFSATSFNFGAILQLEHLSLGVNITSPYTITRKWNNNTTTATVTGDVLEKTSGEDEMKIPLSYAIGVSIMPVESFRIAVDIKQKNYGDTEFVYSQADSTNRSWVDQTVMSFGFNYSPFDFLSILAGYRHQTEIFVPDGGATRDEGPDINSWSFGLSYKADFGTFDVAYITTSMKYYDAYFSNTNYVTQNFDRLLVGYTIGI